MDYTLISGPKKIAKIVNVKLKEQGLAAEIVPFLNRKTHRKEAQVWIIQPYRTWVSGPMCCYSAKTHSRSCEVTSEDRYGDLRWSKKIRNEDEMRERVLDAIFKENKEQEAAKEERTQAFIERTNALIEKIQRNESNSGPKYFNGTGDK